MYSNKLYINRSIFSLALACLLPFLRLAPNTDQFFYFHRYVVFFMYSLWYRLKWCLYTQPNSERIIFILLIHWHCSRDETFLYMQRGKVSFITFNWMTYALHTNFFFLPLLSFSLFFYRHHRNQRKSEAPRFYVLAAYIGEEGLFILSLILSIASMRHIQSSSVDEERKNIENCRSENVSFPVLWFFQWENFSLFYDARNFFFAFISSSTPLFFSSSMVCEWVLLNFFFESCIVLWVMRILNWNFDQMSEQIIFIFYLIIEKIELKP